MNRQRNNASILCSCPETVSSAGRRGRRRRLKGARGRATLATEKPPIFGMIPRGGAVVIRRIENVQQTTIRPLIQTLIAPGTRGHPDEYAILILTGIHSEPSDLL